MTVLWFSICVYLVFSIVAAIEVEIDALPGTSPLQICLAVLFFGLCRPMTAALGRLRTIFS